MSSLLAAATFSSCATSPRTPMFRGGGGGGGRRGGRYAAVDVEAPASSGAAGGKPKPKPSFLVQHGAQLKLLLPYMWPAEEPRLKVLLVLAVACLLASKVCARWRRVVLAVLAGLLPRPQQVTGGLARMRPLNDAASRTRAPVVARMPRRSTSRCLSC